MAAANSPPSGQEPAVGLSINLSSNNPFRNRATSPASPASPFDDPPPRPVSRNPFLDAPPPVRSPGTMSTQSDPKSLTAEDIFDSLTLDDKKPNQPIPAQRPQGNGLLDPKRPENSRPTQGSSRHRPTRSQEEALRARKLQGAPPPRPDNSPQRRPQRRPRRNSESSVMDLNTLTEEEKKMIEARRRERRRAEAREAAARDGKAPEGSSRESKPRDGKPREGSENREGSRKPRDRSHRPSRRMDIIDQLDATSIYGTGLFHHDGPFDALNPHRNRSGRRAPMQAFPKDSMNMSLGGSGPLNKSPDHATFMGNHDEEAFRDWANSRKGRNGSSSTEVPIFDPISRGEVVHGDESVGLGTSTFLEGTPAARAAIAQQAQEEATMGLQRKKSLAQRIRPFKGSREYGHPNRMRSPDGVQSAGLQSTGSGSGEANPFFNEFSKGEESISIRREGALSPTSPPAPRRGSAGVPLERRVTADATPSDETVAPKPTGFIGRMKSLKGPRRPKNTEPPPVGEPPSYPGTAV